MDWREKLCKASGEREKWRFNDPAAFWDVFINFSAVGIRRAIFVDTPIEIGHVGDENVYVDLQGDERFGGYIEEAPDSKVRKSLQISSILAHLVQDVQYFIVLGAVLIGKSRLSARRSGYMAVVEVFQDGRCGQVGLLWNKIARTVADPDSDDDGGPNFYDQEVPAKSFGSTEIIGNLVIIASGIQDLGGEITARKSISGDFTFGEDRLHGISVIWT